MTQHVFQTEVQQLLHLMIHSLYSEREIFLRELISNASDACDKLRFQSLTDAALLKGDDTLRIDIAFNAEERTLVLTDNGIGMTEAEAIEHLGTIAKSGTKAFLQNLGEKSKDANLIGQFGVGFYSSFMVADRVVVESRSATTDADHGVRWESTGDGNFATEIITRAQRGTTVTLHLKEDAKEFAEPWRLRELIKKYSDYVAYPVRLPKWLSDEEKKKGTVAEPEQANSGIALWTRPKDQITEEQYRDFYRAVCKQYDDPATRLHFSVEGTLSFTALLFVPGQKPTDLFDKERRGLNLYVRRVFVMDDCKDLLPENLRFVKGVVDSDDLPLNVSREILQQQGTVQKLRKQLVKRLLDHFTRIATGDDAERAQFAKVDREFGHILREGLVSDRENKDKIAKLARYRSTWTIKQPQPEAKPEEKKEEEAAFSQVKNNAPVELKTGLDDYLARMPEGQKAIYFITAASLDAAKASPHLEGFARAGFEVLFFTDPVDDWASESFDEFAGKKLVHVAKGQDDLAANPEAKEKLEEQTKSFGSFFDFCKESLGGGVSSVRLSNRLTDSPCCLVGEEHSLTPQMEELMKRMGQDVPKQERILELNPTHPLITRLQALYAAGSEQAATKERLGTYVQVLRDQALLAEGGRIADPASFAKRVQDLLLAVATPPAAAAAH